MIPRSHDPIFIRVARQHLVTSQLLGVDFVPVAAVAPVTSDTAVELKVGTQTTLFRPGTAPGGIAVPPELAPGDKSNALEELRKRHDATCPHCSVVQGHANTVFGETNPDADLMFIGEAPGEEEDRTGRPFVGRAGKKLDAMIEAMGLRRPDVYIANILKSRPPGNRTPLPTEVAGCSPFLAEQVAIIRPKVIVALGGPATKWLLQTTTGITRLRGQWASYGDGSMSIPVMPTFHPAYLLRNYTVDTRSKVWSDMQAVMHKLEEFAATGVE